MNNSVINIDGIHAESVVSNLEHSTDKAHLLIIKDEHNNKVYISIVNGKIESTWKK